jgi:hypothetical protein
MTQDERRELDDLKRILRENEARVSAIERSMSGTEITLTCDNTICDIAHTPVTLVVTSNEGGDMPQATDWNCPSCHTPMNVEGRDGWQHQMEKWCDAIRTVNALLGQREMHQRQPFPNEHYVALLNALPESWQPQAAKPLDEQLEGRVEDYVPR